MIPVVIRHRAEADLERARAWYARNDQFPAVGREVRRALLHRFPYATYFVRRADIAIVIAVLHQYRRPGAWQLRAHREGTGFRQFLSAIHESTL